MARRGQDRAGRIGDCYDAEVSVCKKIAYLLLVGSGLKNVIHQYGHEFRHSVYSGGISAILRRAVYWLSLGLGLLEPFAGYRVHYVENPQLVRPGRLFEVRVNLLDEDGFGLHRVMVSVCSYEASSTETRGVPECWRRKATSG